MLILEQMICEGVEKSAGSFDNFRYGCCCTAFLMPVYAIIIVYQCFAAMRRRRRPETPLISLLNPATGEILPVLFWENSIGRSKSSDVTVDDPMVSRNHCVLLRRKDGWYVNDTDSKSGTMLNGKRTRGRAKVLIDDTITIGGTSLIVKEARSSNSRCSRAGFLKGQR